MAVFRSDGILDNPNLGETASDSVDVRRTRKYAERSRSRFLAAASSGLSLGGGMRSSFLMALGVSNASSAPMRYPKNGSKYPGTREDFHRL